MLGAESISEALNLTLGDFTADGLVVRHTKFRKSRRVPLHPTTATALDHYLQQRQRLGDNDDHLFIAHQGRRLTYPMVNGTFHFLLRSVTVRLQPGQLPPRIHGLRHRFAVCALEHCPGPPDRISPHLLALSTYLGHAHVADTYWYLQLTPSLTRAIADACQARLEGGTP
jgi:integrase